MLAIILGILKMIGLLILGILGLVLALLLLVLLVPVRYHARGSYYGTLKGAAGVSWLLHILSCQVVYEGELDMCVRVFGIRLGGRKPFKETETGGERNAREKRKTGEETFEAERNVEAAGDHETGRSIETVRKPENSCGTEESRKAKSRQDSAKNRENDAQSSRTRLLDSDKKQKKQRKFAFRNPFEKIRVTFRKICGKLEALKDKKDQVFDFIGREENQNTFRLLKKQVMALIKHILPEKVRGRLKFGFDDPYTTGQVLTWISPFYGLYAKKLQLTPVFDEKVLEGELELRGRIRIGTLIAIALRIFLDKNFRKLLKKWREA